MFIVAGLILVSCTDSGYFHLYKCFITLSLTHRCMRTFALMSKLKWLFILIYIFSEKWLFILNILWKYVCGIMISNGSFTEAFPSLRVLYRFENNNIRYFPVWCAGFTNLIKTPFHMFLVRIISMSHLIRTVFPFLKRIFCWSNIAVLLNSIAQWNCKTISYHQEMIKPVLVSSNGLKSLVKQQEISGSGQSRQSPVFIDLLFCILCKMFFVCTELKNNNENAHGNQIMRKSSTCIAGLQVVEL